MAFTDSIKRMIGIEDLDDDDMITEEEVNAAKEKMASAEPRRSYTDTAIAATAKKPQAGSSAAKPAAEKRFSVANTCAFKLVLIEPKSFEECPKLVDCLKGRRPVIINLEKIFKMDFEIYF